MTNPNVPQAVRDAIKAKLDQPHLKAAAHGGALNIIASLVAIPVVFMAGSMAINHFQGRAAKAREAASRTTSWVEDVNANRQASESTVGR